MSPVLRVGSDVVHIARFKRVITQTPAVRRRIFLPRELKGASSERLAGTFAAKEAVMKALAIKAGRWQEIEIARARNGKPRLILRRQPRKKLLAHDLSIAHDGDYAVATAVFLISL